MGLVRCFDSVTASAIPPAPLVLGYVDGAYANYDELKATRKAHVISVTTGVAPRADVIDVERGNADPAQAVEWAIQELRHGRRPTIYGGRDTHDEVFLGLHRRRYDPGLVDYWLADYVQVAPRPHEVRWPRRLPKGYAAWQFADSIPTPEGHSYDASVVSERWARRHGWRPPTPPTGGILIAFPGHLVRRVAA